MKMVMKKRAVLIEISVVSILLVLPPVFFPSSGPIQQPSSGFYSAILFFLAVNLLVIYEELLYRLWFPDRLSVLVPENKAAVEMIPLLLFALAHRGPGWASAAFAFAAGGILRFLYIRTKLKHGQTVAFILIFSIHALWNWTLYIFFT